MIMKNTIIVLAISTVLLASCTKKIETCVDGELNLAEPGTYTYSWCGGKTEFIEWKYTDGGESITQVGTEVGLKFLRKGKYSVSVYATKNKRRGYEELNITVGEYEARVEPKSYYGDDYFNSGDGSYVKAYLYHNISNLEIDLTNGDMNNCIDSIDLLSSSYYKETTKHENGGAAMVGGFTGVSSGDYVVYVKTTQSNSSYYDNLLDLSNATYSNSTITVTNGSSTLTGDDICNPLLHGSDPFLFNLLTKTFLLTDVIVNGTSSGVPTCNADDTFIFNIDGTWSHNVGTDNCAGNQTNSAGDYYYQASNSIPITATSGTMTAMNYISASSLGNNVVKITMTEGPNSIEQIYTAQ